MDSGRLRRHRVAECHAGRVRLLLQWRVVAVEATGIARLLAPWVRDQATARRRVVTDADRRLDLQTVRNSICTSRSCGLRPTEDPVRALRVTADRERPATAHRAAIARHAVTVRRAIALHAAHQAMADRTAPQATAVADAAHRVVAAIPTVEAVDTLLVAQAIPAAVQAIRAAVAIPAVAATPGITKRERPEQFRSLYKRVDVNEVKTEARRACEPARLFFFGARKAQKP